MTNLTIHNEVNGAVLTTGFTPDDIEHVIRRQMEIFKDEFGFTDEENDPVIDLIHAFADGLDPETEFILLVKKGGIPVGSVFFTGREKPDSRLRFVYIDTPERGKGYGKAMILAALECAKANGWKHVHLTTYNILTVARRMYASCGFTCTGEAPADWITSQQILEETWERDL